MVKKLKWKSLLVRLFAITVGAVIMAFGLESILIPNNIIDGGITGVSMIISHVLPIRLGVLLFGLNVPFLILGYKHIGKLFAIMMSYGILVLSIATNLLHNVHPIVQDGLLAVSFGGIILGVGVGIVLRNGGVLDGTETLSILLEKKLPLSVGEIIMICNVIIFSLAAFVFGLNNAMYSMLTYFIAFKTMDVVVKGLDGMKAMYIISEYNQEIASEITEQLGRGVTFLNGEGSFSGENKQVIFCVFTRLEEAQMKDIINDIDSSAFIIISDVAEVKGGRFKRKSIH